jgi:ankyrin repeat protein
VGKEITPYEEAARLLMAPLAREAAVDMRGMLRAAAFDGEFAAAAALAAVLARELRLDNWELLFRCDSPEDLLAASEIPGLARAYALGYFPGALLTTPPPVGVIFFPGEERQLFPGRHTRAFRMLQRLVRRNSFLRDEALRAFLIYTLVMWVGEDMPTYEWGPVLYQIMYGAKVVPGKNMDTKFEIGREMISSASAANSFLLYFALTHEFSHFVFNLDMFKTHPAIGGGEDLDALVPMVTDAMRIARRGGDIANSATDLPQHNLPSGARVLCSSQHLPDSGDTLIHVSVSRAGGPVDLMSAARLGWFWLWLAGLPPFEAATAHSPTGIFHLCFLLDDATLREAKRRRPAKETAAAKRTLESEAAQWLDSLRGSGRLVSSEEELIMLAVYGQVRPKSYATRPGAEVMKTLYLSSAIPAMDLSETTPEHVAQFLAVVLRCANADGLRSLSAGASTPLAEVVSENGFGLARIGTLCGIARTPNEMSYLGATAADVRALLPELPAAGADLDEPLDEDGSTLLINAAHRSPDFVAPLLRGGADVNRANRMRETPLILACAYGRDEVVRQLLAAGAAVDAADADGRTPMISALTGEVVRLLCAEGADLDASDNAGLTALIHAVNAVEPELVEELLRQGADPDKPTEDGMTPLHHAAIVRNAERRGQLVALLAAFGAELDERADDGQTPAELAATQGLADAVEQLAALGADVSSAVASLNAEPEEGQ